MPPAVTLETAPPLPEPIEIRPEPNARGQPGSAKKSSRKTDSSSDLPILERVEPPASVAPVPPPVRRSVIDSIFGPLR
jgi:hypothetical protein